MGSQSTDSGGRGGKPLDADEFAARLQESFRPLWLIAAGITRDGSLAEDVVQEAAIIALGKLDAFARNTNFTAWVGQIVRNVALNRARKQRRSRTVPMGPDALGTLKDKCYSDAMGAGSSREDVGRLPSPERSLFDKRVYEALENVGVTARACLLLRTIEGWDYARIAEVLAIPEGTAMSHVHRSRKLLRRLLDSDQSEERDDQASGK